jgi:hypothetical protein
MEGVGRFLKRRHHTKAARGRFLCGESFFAFFVLCSFPAPATKFEKLNLPLHFFFIFLAPVVDVLALLAGEFYEAVLTHTD